MVEKEEAKVLLEYAEDRSLWDPGSLHRRHRNIVSKRKSSRVNCL